ncbi:MAG: SWIM zinc finger family protein, partial [Methanolinea sp.]|nr:SWIM zinc finger family protein [Methanolinea sp.]
WKKIKETHALTPEIRDAIVCLYGDRGCKALAALDRSQVKKYNDFVVVIGASDEYVVEEDYCTCRDFSFRRGHCWHLLAARLADLCGCFEVYDLWYQDTWSGRG